MAEFQATQFDRLSLEALKTIGKTLGQMTLYKVGHPAVAATLKLAEEQLGAAMAQTQQGDLTFSVDQDKLIANGRVIGLMNQTPNAIPALFNRFKLSSLTFKSGLENPELIAFCELAASRPDAALAADPQGYLAERGAAHIVLNEAVYAKMGETPPPPAPSAEAAAAPEAAAQDIQKAIAEQSLEKTIWTLIEKAVPDPAMRKKIFEQVMQLLKTDIERRVEEVTKPLKREKAVLQNEQVRTQTVLENMHDGVIVVDEHGKILMMNPAAEQIYGTTLAQVAGRDLTEKLGEEHVVTLAAELATPDPEKPMAREVRVKAHDDTRRTVQSAAAVVQNEAGRVVGMVASLTDVAKHKELQRMQRDFVSHVTHELRAPLSSIRAALEILQTATGGKMKEDESRMLATALRNSDRLADLISSILDFSKIESGQMTVFPAKADPEKLVREAVESMAPWASKKGVAISFNIPPDLPTLWADPKRTVQVLINLLSNSIKATPAGGQITVRAARSRTSDRFLELSVQDTGCGIPKSEHQRIFDKFVQIASGEVHVGGTGLGLSIAKALVHLQNGTMGVDSDGGKGATFLFTLPVYTGPKEAVPAQAPAAKPAESLPLWKRLLGLK